MNYFSKYRLVFWVMILMILINVSAFSTFFLYYRANKPSQSDTTSCSGTCRFLNEQLALTAEQTASVKKINQDFRTRTEPVVAEIKQTRTDLLAELALDKPDTSALNRYTEKIGELQKALQKAAILQFQQLKQICNPDQCLKLSAIYSEVYGCSKMGAQQCKKMEPGHENGQCK